MPQTVTETDQQLIGRVRSGDLAGLDALFERHHARVYGFIHRWLGDAHAAEDLVQDTFLRVLRQNGKTPLHEDLLPWLLRIAHNLVIDRYRRERHDLMVDDFAQITDPGPIPLERLTATEREQQLADALAAIAPPHREVLLLRAAEGLDYRDIALLLGCTEGAARVRVHRATAALRTEWYSKHGEQRD